MMSRNSFVIIMAALCSYTLLNDPRVLPGEAWVAIVIYTVLIIIPMYLDRPPSTRQLRFKCSQFEIELTTVTGRPISHSRRIR
jgi:hypothetical protein